MPVSSVTEHWIKPDAVTINLNHFGDPDYLQVSVLAGAVVMAFKQDVIAYNAAHNYRTWPLQASNTYLETTSAYNVYARLTRSEVNASALIVYDPILRDIEGRPISHSEDGSELLGEEDLTYFYVFLGRISGSINSNGEKTDRFWLETIRFGTLDSSEQKNNFGSLWEKLFKPHYDDPFNPDKLSWIEAKANIGVQGGVTMFVKGDNIYIPTIAEGLPFDNRTIWFNPTTGQIEVIGGTGGGTGGGNGEGVSNFWDLSGIPSWITNTKPTYNYSEIKNTPDLSVYALKSAIPSLSGYATEQWVLSQGYALSSDLSKYIPISGTTKITGEKDFTGGLKVNGSPIVYDSRGFWKLEGDLLVTGGVSMYSNDIAFTPSTIMDAIVVDGTTISKEGGVLKVIGSIGGGIADSVAWGNVLGKPSWITNTAPIIGVSGVNVSLGGGISQSSLRTALGLGSLAYKSSLGKADVGLGNVENTALSTWVGTSKITTLGTITTGTWNGTKIANSYLANSAITISGTSVSLGGSITQSALRTALGLGNNAYTSTAYLPLTGGTLTNADYQVLSITRATTANDYGIALNFSNSNGTACDLVAHRTTHYFKRGYDGNSYTIWDSGNDGSDSGLDADLLDGKQPSELNVGSATKLQTARTIWGHSFDGTGNVSGDAKFDAGYGIWHKDTTGNYRNTLYFDANNILSVGLGTSGQGYNTDICGNNINLKYGTSRILGMTLNSSGNITIGSSDLAGTTYKMYVDGNPAINGTITKYNKDKTYRLGISHYNNEARLYNIIDDGSVYGNIRIGTSGSNCIFFDGVNYRLGIKTTSPDYSLDVNGAINTNNNIYAQTTSNVIRQIKVANDVGSTALYVTTSGNRGLYDLNDNSWIIYTDGTNTISSTKTHIQRSNVIYHNNKMLYWYQSDNATSMSTLYVNASNALVLGKGTAQVGGATYLDGNVIYFRYGKSNTTGMYLNSSGNVGIGTSSPSQKLHVAGNILVTGGTTMYSARKLKNITDERGLSLKELSAIKPTRFTWKDGRDNKIHIGGIADDVQRVLPEVIYKTDDDVLTMDYGNAAFAISASLIKPVISHEERIKVLEEENERLKREIEQLKWYIA